MSTTDPVIPKPERVDVETHAETLEGFQVAFSRELASHPAPGRLALVVSRGRMSVEIEPGVFVVTDYTVEHIATDAGRSFGFRRKEQAAFAAFLKVLSEARETVRKTADVGASS